MEAKNLPVNTRNSKPGYLVDCWVNNEVMGLS